MVLDDPKGRTDDAPWQHDKKKDELERVAKSNR